MKKTFLFLWLIVSIRLMAQEPKLILPISDGESYLGQFSPDGKKILTYSVFGPSRIWDGESGKLLVDSMGQTYRLSYACFSPESKRVLTCYFGDTARIWELSTGKQWGKTIQNISGKGLVQFSRDGNYVIYLNPGFNLTGERGEDDSLYRIWDAGSGKQLLEMQWKTHKVAFTLFGPEGRPLSSANELSGYLKNNPDDLLHASISPDAKKILTVSRKGELKLWNSFSGRLQTTIRGYFRTDASEQFSPDGSKIITIDVLNKARVYDVLSGRFIAEWNEIPVDSTMGLFSLDGKRYMLITNGGSVRIRNTTNGQLLDTFNKIPSDYAFAQFFTGKGRPRSLSVAEDNLHLVREILIRNEGEIIPAVQQFMGVFFKMMFSVDGRKIVTLVKEEDAVIASAMVRDAATGKMLFALKGHTALINECVFNADGSKVLIITWDSVSQVREVATGQLLIDLRHFTFRRNPFSKDGNELLVIDNENAIVRLDATTGRIISRLKKTGLVFNDAELSEDGTRIFSLTDSGHIIIWDAMNGNLVSEIKENTVLKSFIRFSPGGDKLAIPDKDSVTIVDVNSGKILMRCPGKFWPIMFSPDGKKILTGISKKDTRLWEIATGKVLLTIPPQDTTIKSAQFSPRGDKILTVTRNEKVRIWDAANGKLLADLSDSSGWPVAARFTNDGKKIITMYRGDTLRVWDANSGKRIAGLKKVAGNFYDTRASFSPDEKTITTYWGDNVFRTWETKTGELLYSFWCVDSADHLVVDPNNRYDGTEAARKLLYFVCGDEIVELEQVKDQLWVPGLAERLVKGETINAKTLSQLNICGLTPEVENAVTKPGEYFFRIKPRRGGLGESVLYINGIEVRRYKPAELKKNGGNYELLVKEADLAGFFIAGKENPVTVRAYTADNSISSRGGHVIADQTKLSVTAPSLYAVMVGVSDYKGSELDLKYAAKDATDISGALSGAAKKLLNTDGKEHVFMYNLTTANERYQLPEKNAIKKILEEIGKKAAANDILLVFFAGHGVMAGDAEKKQFYFLTADASSLAVTEAVRDVGISTSELIDWIKPQQIKAQKRILIFDACNSGQAINDFVKVGKEGQGYLAARNDDRAQQIKAIDKLNEKSGLFILSASASNQSAYEMGRYSQGLLTYSLLKAIKQQPDILEDGKYLNVSRWFNEAGKTVSDISKESGARQEPQIVTNTNFNIGIVDAEVMAKIVLPEEKPLFAASIFFNSDEAIADDDLEFSKLVNMQLSDIASRGAESKIVYVTATNAPDAYSLTGRYEVKGNAITVRVNVKQNKEIKFRFEQSGTKDKINELAASIAAKGAESVK